MKRILNTAFALIVLAALLSFFLSFFYVKLYGVSSDKENGFEMAAILFGKDLSKNEILIFVKMAEAWKVYFASFMAVFSIIVLTLLFCVFVFRAISKKPVHSKYVSRLIVIALVVVIIQFLAFELLATTVTKLFYDACCMGVTYSGKTFSFVPPAILIALTVLFFKTNKEKDAAEGTKINQGEIKHETI